MQLTQEHLKELTRSILKNAQTGYGMNRGWPITVLVLIATPDGELIGQPAPDSIVAFYLAARRRQYVDLMKIFKQKLEEANIEVVGFCTAAEAWSALLTKDNEIHRSENLVDSRVRIPASKHPDRKEVFTINYAMKDRSLNHTVVYDIERDPNKRVTGLRRVPGSELEQVQSLLDEVWK